jgi:uncharacterized protein YbjT (DUF2867 family)
MSKTILITGATGNQGGAVIKALQGTSFEILAVTRNSTSPSALKLASSSPNIKLVQGDLDNTPALFESASKFATNPIWGVYSVQAKPTGDVSIEETQGKALIDAAIAANVQFFVYSSADRGGDKSSENPTPVPHWATKHRVEKYLEEKAHAARMQYTVLRPVCFMENLSNDFAGKAMAGSWSAVLKDKPLKLVATRDIGWFAAEAFKRPDEFAGRYISLAGTGLTFAQANAVFREKFGRDLPAVYGCVAKGLLLMIRSLGVMFEYIKKNEVGGDVEELRRMNPGMMDLGTWLEKDSQFRVV